MKRFANIMSEYTTPTVSQVCSGECRQPECRVAMQCHPAWPMYMVHPVSDSGLQHEIGIESLAWRLGCRSSHDGVLAICLIRQIQMGK
jgi:hypothetical protein